MTIHEHPESDFDPDEQAAWEEFQKSLDELHYGRLPSAAAEDIPTPTDGDYHDDHNDGGLTGRVVFDHNFWTRNREGEQWLIEPILALGRSHALYAPAKAGKSLLALDIAAALAAGRPCLGQPAGERRRVLYADFEMTEDDLYERLCDLGYSEDVNLDCLHYHLHPVLPPLDSVLGGQALVAHAATVGAELVVVDTVARTIAGEENSADTIIGLARHTFTPLKRAGVTSLRVDHSGKDLTKGQRGSSAKNDDVDVVWQLTVGDANWLILKATHRRLAWVPAKVDLTRVENPLRHLVGAEAWPAGTLEAAAQLDASDAPIDITVRAARALIGGKNSVVAAACKYRRMALEEAGNTPGNALDDLPGKHVPVTDSTTPSEQRVTPSVTGSNSLPGDGVTVYPP